jgi:hypothetical protein
MALPTILLTVIEEPVHAYTGTVVVTVGVSDTVSAVLVRWSIADIAIVSGHAPAVASAMEEVAVVPDIPGVGAIRHPALLADA